MGVERALLNWLKIRVTAAIFLVVFAAVKADAADLRSNAESWKRAFSTLSENHIYVARVNSIFEKLKSVVGSSVLLSELVILDSNNQPWAIALEDGNVVLSRGALDIVYGDSNASLEAKDARMAFVLGHELNHIAKSDFWHEQVYRGFVDRTSSSTNSTDLSIGSRRRESELRSDEDGFIYASLAGFNTREIFTPIGAEPDFLHYWVRQTATDIGVSNHNEEDRVAFLTNTLQSLDASVEFFNYGTRLAYFGHYESAKALFDEFYKIYPSHQVLSNLGYVHLQMARQAMPIELANQYWYPALLDYESGLPQTTRTLNLKLPPDSIQHLKTAIKVLNQALVLDANATNTLKNLATSYLYLGKISQARAVLTLALETKPEDYQLQTLLVIAVLHDQTTGDQWDTPIVKNLIQMASRSDAPTDLLYNIARLYTAQGKSELADNYWLALLSVVESIPSVYRELLCLVPANHERCASIREQLGVKPLQWLPDNTTGIAIGANIDDKSVRKELQKWGEPLLENLGNIDAAIYRHTNGNSLVTVNRIVTVVNQKQHVFDFKQHLLDVNRRAGSPELVEFSRGSTTILSSGTSWAASLYGERVNEIWFSITP